MFSDSVFFKKKSCTWYDDSVKLDEGLPEGAKFDIK